MSAKHTPGPWTIGVSADHTPLVMVPAPSGQGSGFGIACINRMPRLGIVPGDMNANARLIAAAPEMYQALLYYAEKRNYEGVSMDSFAPVEADQGSLARAALAKARGES